jgi:histidinol-phosphate aminotransferase
MEYKFNSRLDCRRLHLNEFRFKHCDSVLKFAPEYTLENYTLISHDSDVISDIARYNRTSAENITLTVGSDDALRILIGTNNVSTIGPYYGYIDNICNNIGAKVSKSTYVSHAQFNILYIASPNNPDSIVYTHSQIRQFCKMFKMVIVDEAYIEFMDNWRELTAANLVIDNLFVTRTFSKAFGLASVRAGYIISNGLGKELQYKVNPKNFSPLINIVSVVLENAGYYQRCANELREYAIEFFSKLPSVLNVVGGSVTNFYMLETKDSKKAVEIFEENGILVREKDNNYIRITLGTKEDNDAVYEVIMRNLKLFC